MPPSNNPNDTDYNAQLATVEMQVNALADTAPIVEQVAGALDYLYETGADATAIQAVSDGATQLLDANQQLSQAMHGVAEIARTIQQQRNATRQALSDLKTAVAQADTSVPEISDLYDALSEMAQEDAEAYLYDWIYENLADGISCNTSLSYNEAIELVDVLTGDLLAEDHPIWQELREWLARALAVLEDGIRPLEADY